jgi:hypothetical protein
MTNAPTNQPNESDQDRIAREQREREEQGGMTQDDDEQE